MKGFTLVECVIAVALVALTMAGLLSGFVMSKQSAEVADDRIRAMQFTRSNLENLLTNSWSSSLLTVGVRTNWTTNLCVQGRYTNQYVCSYAISTTKYTTARVVCMTNRWSNVNTRKTNTVSLATSFSSGFH